MARGEKGKAFFKRKKKVENTRVNLKKDIEETGAELKLQREDGEIV